MMQTFLDGPLSYIRYKLWVVQMAWILLQEGLGETQRACGEGCISEFHRLFLLQPLLTGKNINFIS